MGMSFWAGNFFGALVKVSPSILVIPINTQHTHNTHTQHTHTQHSQRIGLLNYPDGDVFFAGKPTVSSTHLWVPLMKDPHGYESKTGLQNGLPDR